MEPFRLGSRYYFSRLNEEEKITYRRIYDFWHAGGTEARILMPGLGFQFPSGLPLFDLVTYILEDNPHLFHLEITHFHYQRQGAYVTITTNNVYTPEEYQQIYTQLIRRTGEIVQMARRYSTDVEKLRFLHDYLAQSVTYRKDESNPRTAREIHTIVGSLLNRFCVCDGYARAFRLLCDQLHISCIVVSGTGHSAADTGPHAWNVVKFDSNVYHVDVTWDSNLGVVAGELSDYYFLRGDRFFFQDHSWDASLPPHSQRLSQAVSDPNPSGDGAVHLQPGPQRPDHVPGRTAGSNFRQCGPDAGRHRYHPPQPQSVPVPETSVHSVLPCSPADGGSPVQPRDSVTQRTKERCQPGIVFQTAVFFVSHNVSAGKPG